MGDISELRGLIVTVSFLGVLTILLMGIPCQFLISSVEAKAVDIPDWFDAADMQFYAETKNFTNIGEGFNEVFEFGGRTIKLYNPYEENYVLSFKHEWTEWWFWYCFDSLKWMDNTGKVISYELTLPGGLFHRMSINTLNVYPMQTKYKVQCEHFFMHISFAWNITQDNSLKEAYDNSRLGVWMGVHFDQVNTSYNAWDIIAMVLWFKLPNTHPLVNALVAIPIAVSVIYISFILILRTIGAVFGGGGA